MNSGYVYILMNSSMNDLLKIGKTVRDPQTRVKELSSATGVPTPFTLIYFEYFEDCSYAEVVIHELLSSYRVSQNREFFSLPVYQAIKAIQKLKEQTKSTENLINENELVVDKEGLNSNTLSKEILEKAEEYYYGFNDTLEDYFEAYKLFKKAANLGSGEAYHYLGNMHWNGEGCREDKTLAFDFQKKGAALGNADCYAKMGFWYMLDPEVKNLENGKKCWMQYFKYLSTKNHFEFKDIASMSDNVWLSVDNNMVIEHLEIIKRNEKKLIEEFKQTIERIKNGNYDQWFKNYKIKLTEKCIDFIKNMN